MTNSPPRIQTMTSGAAGTSCSRREKTYAVLKATIARPATMGVRLVKAFTCKPVRTAREAGSRGKLAGGRSLLRVSRGSAVALPRVLRVGRGENDAQFRQPVGLTPDNLAELVNDLALLLLYFGFLLP